MTEKSIHLADDRQLRIGTAVDITIRKKFEEELIKQRDHSELYLEISPVMFVALDNKGNITMMNQMASRVLECTSEDCVGKD